VVNVPQFQTRESRKLITNDQCLIYLQKEAIPGYIYIKVYHRASNRSKYADGYYISMIYDNDGHIPSPLIMFTSTGLRHALLEWQKNKGDPPKACK